MKTSVVSNLDYFKRPIQFLFNKKEYIYTNLGSFFSILIYSLILALCFILGSDIYYKENAVVNQVNLFQQIAPKINLKDKEIVYIVQMQDSFSSPIYDPTLFTIEISKFLVQRFDNGSVSINYYDLETNNCSIYEDYFRKNNITNTIKSNNLIQTGVCFNINTTNITIGGDFSSTFFSNINYKVKKCVNSTTNNITCKSNEIIEKTLQASSFAIFYMD